MPPAKTKILVIDDEEDNLTVLNNAFKQAFPDTIFLAAANGLKGIALTLAEDPDMILLDIVMPELDGFEICRRLKSDARIRHIPVVFLAAFKPTNEICAKAFEAGGEAFLLKPPEFWELTVQLRAMRKIKAANMLQRADHDLLGMLVAQRTCELQEKLKLEEQLRQSQKMEAVGNLAGGIAHDFNNILSVILAYSGFLLKSLEQADPRREDAEEIHKAVLRAASLTRQLLVFSRKQVLRAKVLDVYRVILDMKTMLTRLIGENIELTVSTSEAPARIKADQGCLEQVLLNLSVNARDAMPEGGKLVFETSIVGLVEAHIHRHGTIEPGDYVMVSVSDTGCGMSAETLSHVFEPFFTTKPSEKGTGLGLSMVHGIIKQSGGHITIHSEERVGTVFNIYFPRVAGEVSGAERQAAVKNMFTGTATILVVDDDLPVRTLVRRILTHDGFTVLDSASAEDALAVCKRHRDPIHLVLTDIVLPKMSGFDLAGRLESAHPELKVLFMSGYTDYAVPGKEMLDPEKNFIQKPFTFDALVNKVREALLA